MNAMNANQSRFHSSWNDGLLNVFIMSMLPVNSLYHSDFINMLPSYHVLTIFTAYGEFE